MPTPAVQLPSGRLVKVAAGDSQTFETSLASIGRSFLGSKAPNLFKHEIGFQVVDADDDNTRAVGVFGFRVGKRLLYTPLFYRDGVVKGTEQLRDPKKKLCVPLTDNWVNYFMNQEEDDLGTRVPRSQTRDTSQPTLWQFKYPPTKYAADDRGWVKAAFHDLARAIGVRPKWADPDPDFDLMKIAAEYPALLQKVGDWAVNYSWFGTALERYYGRAKVAATLAAAQPPPQAVNPMTGTVFEGGGDTTVPATAKGKAVKATAKASPVSPEVTATPSAVKAAAVTVIRYREVTVHKAPLHGSLDFAAPELDDLKKGKNAYRDNRPDGQVSDADLWLGGHQFEQESISNPTESGIYEVLTREDGKPKVRKCVVLTALLGFGPRVNRCLVVDPETKAYTYTHRNAVWVRGQADRPAYWDWVKKLPKVDNSLPVDKKVVVVSEKGSATSPFSLGSSGDGGARGGYREVKWDKPFWAPFDPFTNTPRDRRMHDDKNADNVQPRVIPLDQAGGSIITSGADLYLPRDVRVLELKDDYNDRAIPLMAGSDPDHFLLHYYKQSAAGRKYLVVRKTAGDAFEVDDPRTRKAAAFRDANDAEEHLVVAHGLRAKQARELVDRAAREQSSAAFVKYAERLSTNYPNAPSIDHDMVANPAGFADDILPATTSASQQIPIQDMMMQPGAPDRYRPYPVGHGVKIPLPGIGNDPSGSGGTPGRSDIDDQDAGDDLSTVATAAATGRKELFDTAALGSLVKHTKIQGLLDRVSPRMLRTVSDLGDVCAHLYWNVDDWAEQFGQSEVGPLEDQLRGLFEGLGEAFLTLKEKSVQANPDAGILPDIEGADGADAAD